MCEPVTMSLLAAGTLFSAYGTYQQGQAAQDAARYNAQMAEYAAQDAERRGEEDALAVRRKAASLKSSQRVDLGGRGIVKKKSTAQDLQDQTDFFGEQDVATARYNARTQAWSARAGGKLARAEGNAAAHQGLLGAGGTLLQGAGMVSSKWSTKKPSGTT